MRMTNQHWFAVGLYLATDQLVGHLVGMMVQSLCKHFPLVGDILLKLQPLVASIH